MKKKVNLPRMLGEEKIVKQYDHTKGSISGFFTHHSNDYKEGFIKELTLIIDLEEISHATQLIMEEGFFTPSSLEPLFPESQCEIDLDTGKNIVTIFIKQIKKETK